MHWRHLPPALEPTPGTPDADGCFSGRCVGAIVGIEVSRGILEGVSHAAACQPGSWGSCAAACVRACTPGTVDVLGGSCFSASLGLKVAAQRERYLLCMDGQAPVLALILSRSTTSPAPRPRRRTGNPHLARCSCVLDSDGTPVLLYTGVRLRSNLEAGPLPPPEQDLGMVWIETQMAAVPEDPGRGMGCWFGV